MAYRRNILPKVYFKDIPISTLHEWGKKNEKEYFGWEFANEVFFNELSFFNFCRDNLLFIYGDKKKFNKIIIRIFVCLCLRIC